MAELAEDARISPASLALEVAEDFAVGLLATVFLSLSTDSRFSRTLCQEVEAQMMLSYCLGEESVALGCST